MSVCRMGDSPRCPRGTCSDCDNARLFSDYAHNHPAAPYIGPRGIGCQGCDHYWDSTAAIAEHTHVTRDIKKKGKGCPACDAYHDRHTPLVLELRKLLGEWDRGELHRDDFVTMAKELIKEA